MPDRTDISRVAWTFEICRHRNVAILDGGTTKGCLTKSSFTDTVKPNQKAIRARLTRFLLKRIMYEALGKLLL